jgi:hypothetical protein
VAVALVVLGVLIASLLAVVAVLLLALRRGLDLDPVVVDESTHHAVAIARSSGAARRVISVEVLNPIELAASRGRILGFAGSLAPGLTRRIVHDQVVKQLRVMFAEHGVVADIQVHSFSATTAAPSAERVTVAPDVLEEVETIFEAEVVDEPIDDADSFAAVPESSTAGDERFDQPPV